MYMMFNSIQMYRPVSRQHKSYVAVCQLTSYQEWVAGDHGSVAQWDYGVTSDNVAFHKIHRQTQLAFGESFDQANWGNWYYSTANSEDLSFQSGSDKTVRSAFETNGKLGNSEDTNYRPINKDWPVFGFSTDLGSIHKDASSTLYTIGLAQKEAIQFNGASGIRPLPSLWSSYFSSEDEAVSSHINLVDY